MVIRTVIAEDEPLARERLRDLLAADPEIELVGESADGAQALAVIRETQPDLVFLDVKMPELDGFGVLNQVQDELPAAVVFVTAYDQYAVKAFEVNALDYLLKPFDRRRLDQCLQRVKDHLTQHDTAFLQGRLRDLLQVMQSQPGVPTDRLTVKSSGKVVFVATEEIDWIEASDNYVRLHTRHGEHLMRETMSALEARLDAKRFLRISRSVIVNVDRIREIQPLFHGDSVIILTGGVRLNSSRGYRERLKGFLRG